MANFDVAVYDILNGAIIKAFTANEGAEAINKLRAYANNLCPERVVPIDLKAVIKNNVLNRQIEMVFVPVNNKLQIRMKQEN